MKRLLSLALALLMLLCVAACAKDPDEPADPAASGTSGGNTDTAETYPELNLPDMDFGGQEFRILALGAETYTTELWCSEEDAAAGNDVDQEVYNRAMKIAEDYGAIIEITSAATRDEIDMWMNVNSLSASPADTYHLVANHGRYVAKYVVNSLTGDWNRLYYVDLNAEWWSQDAREQWTAPSGSIYMMMGDISYGSVGQAIGLFFNKKILRDSEMEYPYQMVRDGTWTFEVFCTYVADAAASLNGDGTGSIDSDSFGYVTGKSRGPQNILNSVGEHWVTIDNGNYSLLSQNTGNVSDAFDDYFELIYESEGCICLNDNATPSTKMLAALNENRAAFIDDRIAFSAELNSLGADFGVVPYPKYDSNVDGYRTFVNAAANTFCVPNVVTADEETADFASVVIEAMAYYGGRDILPTYYETLLTYRSQTDVESIEMVGIIRDGLTFDLAYYHDLNGLCDIGSKIAEKNGNSNFVTEYQQRISGANAQLDIWLNLP